MSDIPDVTMKIPNPPPIIIHRATEKAATPSDERDGIDGAFI